MPEWLNTESVVMVIGGLITLVPAAQWAAKLTATKADDEIVEKVAQVLHDLLAYIPIHFGTKLADKQILQQAKENEP